MNAVITTIFILASFVLPGRAYPQSQVIFDDKMLLDGYAEKYSLEPKEILLEMIKDDTLAPYKTAAAIRVFKEKFVPQIVYREKAVLEKILLRRLARTDSSFVEIEIMHALCLMDRYKYFPSLVPDLLQKLDHYNKTVNEIAYTSLKNIIDTGHNRPREARLVFNTLRKMFFLSRRRLQDVKDPDSKLTNKLDILKWSIKILGTQELRKLPSEVISLL